MRLPLKLDAAVPVEIVGTGYYLPDRVLTNADLEKMVDTNSDWIVERTGIYERRIADPDMATSDMAINASKNPWATSIAISSSLSSPCAMPTS